VVGIVRRQLGKYQKGYAGGFDEDYEPPTLKITGTIEVIQVRKTIRTKILEVQQSQIVHQTEMVTSGTIGIPANGSEPE
jgi:hypothetical protein